MKKVECIDFFKGLSIIGIVMYHLISLFMKSVPSVIKYASNIGSSGVLIFFFCSGFVMYISDYKKHYKYKEFILKKIKKIYIPYIIIVLISSLVPFIPYGNNKLVALLSHIFQFRCLSNAYFNSFGGHFWYISTIFQFYILFYLLLILLKKLGRKKFLILIFIINIAYVLTIYHFKLDSNPIFTRLFPKYIIEFGLGMVISQMYIKNELHDKINMNAYLIIGILGIVILGISSKTSVGRLLNDIPSFVGVLSLFYWLYRLDIKSIKNIFLFFSNISYEWYLTHMLVFYITFHYFFGNITTEIICGIISFIISIIIAIIYSKLLKKVKV